MGGRWENMTLLTPYERDDIDRGGLEREAKLHCCYFY